jgi:replicative DNA helicase
VHSRLVITPLQALESLNTWREARAPLRTTGFAGLDEMTGGFEPGQVWIVVGTPGQGRSTLATQWALLLASEHGFATQLVSMRDPAQKTAARLVSSAGKVPENHVWRREGPSQLDDRAMSHARKVLSRAPLEISDPTGISIVDTDMPEVSRPEALVVDDADLAAGIFPMRIPSFLELDMLVVLTFPRTHLMADHGIDLSWARVADFIIDIDRPDMFEVSTTRPGEADFHVLRNRWGPSRTHTVAYQGHYAQFIDMAE